MKNGFEQTRFSVESTNDGSPTLRLPDQGESMHHSAGAASETVYIYKSVIQQATGILPQTRTCVVGLGLGYIEISWAQVVSDIENHKVTSFEIEDSLKQSFMNWLQLEAPNEIYDKICESLDPQFQIHHIKRNLHKNYLENPFEADLRQYVQSGASTKWNIVCYDAFSSKTNQELWSEDFLRTFVGNHCEEDCVFTTYACTGILKKVLISKGFEFVSRPRFKGWKDSTLALRGRFKEYSPSFSQTF